jgi:hypothetical protein
MKIDGNHVVFEERDARAMSLTPEQLRWPLASAALMRDRAIVMEDFWDGAKSPDGHPDEAPVRSKANLAHYISLVMHSAAEGHGVNPPVAAVPSAIDESYAFRDNVALDVIPVEQVAASSR